MSINIVYLYILKLLCFLSAIMFYLEIFLIVLLRLFLDFQSWREEDDEDNPSSSKGPSWFKKEFSAKGSKRDWTGNRGPKQQGRSKDISSALMLKEKLHLLLQNYT